MSLSRKDCPTVGRFAMLNVIVVLGSTRGPGAWIWQFARSEVRVMPCSLSCCTPFVALALFLQSVVLCQQAPYCPYSLRQTLTLLKWWPRQSKRSLRCYSMLLRLVVSRHSDSCACTSADNYMNIVLRQKRFQCLTLLSSFCLGHLLLHCIGSFLSFLVLQDSPVI